MSLGEINSLVKSAALGAGLPHGAAEDAGKSAVWLVGAGLDRGAAIADALDGAAGRCRRDRLCDDCAGATDGNSRSALCLAPLAFDGLYAAAAGEAIALGRINVPLLVVALAAWRSEQVDFGVKVAWSGSAGAVEAHCRGGAVSIAAPDREALTDARDLDIGLVRDAPALREPVLIGAAELAANRTVAIEQGVYLEQDAARRILVHAGESYVPASETSRLSGAGAGLIDRD